MSFKKIEPQRGMKSPITNVRVGAWSAGDRFVTSVSIPEQIAQSLGWDFGETLVAALGGGTDTGWFAVEPDKRGTIKLAKQGRAFNFKTTILPCDRKVPTRDAEYRVAGRTLIVRLPSDMPSVAAVA